MQVSGYVLAGGASSRMGQDKALLPYGGTTLVERLAGIVREAAGSVAVVGDPKKYGGLGYSVFADRLPGCGPLGGLYTALSISSADWNLVVACDMPGISVEILHTLLDGAGASSKNCVVAASVGGEMEPLCAIYHRRCLAAVSRAIQEKRFKMKDLVAELDPLIIPVDPAALLNVNTPAEWAEFEGKPR
jgi:molybdenum cofactor guanylyltransferase